jgi:protocatechuate 3,4-dioxygenase beta subunit
MLNRSDIRSDPSDNSVREGVPLRLALTLQAVEGNACTPLRGALVDVWHCDAEGLYSDVQQNNTVGEKFLRGYQLTDDNGSARFTTVYPGWYMSRAVHIHVKVRLDPESQQGYRFTSQLFFDEAVTDQVHAQAPYSDRGTRDTMNETDSIYRDGGNQMLLELTRDGQGYRGTIDIGVQMS